MGRLFSTLGIASALLLAPAAARASAQYPALIQQQLGLTCTPIPQCTYCHNNPNGGRGTVTTRFGVELRGLGLVGSDPAELQAVIAQDHAESLDANGDGLPDTQALSQCEDPNIFVPTVTADGGLTMPGALNVDPTPQYGCECSVGRVGRPRGSWLAVLAGALLWRRARRRGR